MGQVIGVQKHGKTWDNVDVYIYSIWIYMDLYGSIWIYMDLYGSIWIYMDLYGSLWLINCVFFMTKRAMVQVVSSENLVFFVQLPGGPAILPRCAHPKSVLKTIIVFLLETIMSWSIAPTCPNEVQYRLYIKEYMYMSSKKKHCKQTLPTMGHQLA